MKSISILGIDTGKNIFHVFGVDSRGAKVFKRKFNRKELMEFMSNLPRCIVAMEVCGGVNYLAREFIKLGFDTRVIAPQFVKPFLKSNKNDFADAEAICEAAARPQMRFVPVKEQYQQDLLSFHRMRAQFVRNRTSIVNAIHGFALENGVSLPKPDQEFKQQVQILIDPSDTRVSLLMKEMFSNLLNELKHINEQIQVIEIKLEDFAKENDRCKRLQTIPGVGLITSTALVASIGNPHLYKDGRSFSASLGLVPRQNSTGGKTILLGISKRGDPYLRTMLVHGARSIVVQAIRHVGRGDRLRKWAYQKRQTHGWNKTVVAVANKLGRISWKMMATPEEVYKNMAA